MIIYRNQLGFFLSPVYKHLKGIFIAFFKKNLLEEIHCITNEDKTAKNGWEKNDCDFCRALCSAYKKLG